MKPDPIIEDIRKTRYKIFEECNNDLETYLNYLKDAETKDKNRMVNNKCFRENGHNKDSG